MTGEALIRAALAEVLAPFQARVQEAAQICQERATLRQATEMLASIDLDGLEADARFLPDRMAKRLDEMSAGLPRPKRKALAKALAPMLPKLRAEMVKAARAARREVEVARNTLPNACADLDGAMADIFGG